MNSGPIKARYCGEPRHVNGVKPIMKNHKRETGIELAELWRSSRFSMTNASFDNLIPATSWIGKARTFVFSVSSKYEIKSFMSGVRSDRLRSAMGFTHSITIGMTVESFKAPTFIIAFSIVMAA